MRRTKVCIVAPVHQWDDVRVFRKQAVTLSEAGYDVVLLAQADGPLERDGVRVEPAPVPPTPRGARFLALPRVLRRALRERADLYHLHNPDTLPIALALKLLGRKVVYDTHEDFAERLRVREWIPSALRGLLAWGVARLETLAAALVDASIATQDDVAERLRHGTVVVGNPPRLDRDLLRRVEELAEGIVDPFEGLRAVYIGGISVARGSLDMVDAMEQVNAVSPARLWLVGADIDGALDAARARPGWRYVDLVDWQPQERALAYVARSDVGLIVLRDVGGHRRIDPNKLYEYMALGIPFVGSDFPDWRRRLQSCDAGWFVRPGDPVALATALLAARDARTRKEKGQAGQRLVDTYNWARESEKLLSLYASLAPARGSADPARPRRRPL